MRYGEDDHNGRLARRPSTLERTQELRGRTKAYSLQVIELCKELPNTRAAWRIGDQVFRSATSVGAHYREACRAKSDADFISKMEGAIQELDESSYWLELLAESETAPRERVAKLLDETNQLTGMFVTRVKNLKDRLKGELTRR